MGCRVLRVDTTVACITSQESATVVAFAFVSLGINFALLFANPNQTNQQEKNTGAAIPRMGSGSGSGSGFGFALGAETFFGLLVAPPAAPTVIVDAVLAALALVGFVLPAPDIAIEVYGHTTARNQNNNNTRIRAFVEPTTTIHNENRLGGIINGLVVWCTGFD